MSEPKLENITLTSVQFDLVDKLRLLQTLLKDNNTDNSGKRIRVVWVATGASEHNPLKHHGFTTAIASSFADNSGLFISTYRNLLNQSFRTNNPKWELLNLHVDKFPRGGRSNYDFVIIETDTATTLSSAIETLPPSYAPGISAVLAHSKGLVVIKTRFVGTEADFQSLVEKEKQQIQPNICDTIVLPFIN